MGDAITQVPDLTVSPGMIVLWVVLGIWMAVTVVLKAIALWKAARLGSKDWFVVLFILSTAGILELIYIFAVAKKKEKESLPASPQAPQI